MSGPKGMRVVSTRKPEWGLGHVLFDDGGTRVTVRGDVGSENNFRCVPSPNIEVARLGPAVTGGASRATAPPFIRNVDVETAPQAVRVELPGYDIRVLNWYRPKRDYSPPA